MNHLSRLIIFSVVACLMSCQSNSIDEEFDTPIQIPDGFVSVAHRGYHPKGVAENTAESYRYAKLAGFDYGETDIQWTKDNIPVCCHLEYFIDNTTKDSIFIGRHTLDELKKFNYLGTSISSLKEVMDVCKQYGLGLYLDRFTSFGGDRKEKIYELINDFGKEKVCYIFGNREIEGIRQVLAFDSCATIALLDFNPINQSLVDFANTISNPTNKVILDLDHTTNPSKLLKEYQPRLNANVHYSVFTINNKKKYREYLPYVVSITSDDLSTGHLR